MRAQMVLTVFNLPTGLGGLGLVLVAHLEDEDPAGEGPRHPAGHQRQHEDLLPASGYAERDHRVGPGRPAGSRPVRTDA